MACVLTVLLSNFEQCTASRTTDEVEMGKREEEESENGQKPRESCSRGVSELQSGSDV